MSCMRFSERSTVVLPHPDGPMNAVISFAAMSTLTSSTAVTPLYCTLTSESWNTISRCRSGSSSGARSSGGDSAGPRDPDSSRVVVTAPNLVATVAVSVTGCSTWSGRGRSTGVQGGEDSGRHGEHEHDGDEGQRGAPGPGL